jgi:glycerol dehydrogenase-like iron-containing ADH family enzyme
MVSDIPNDVVIVGMGGGSVLDAAKYFAVLKNQTPVLIPTITSSNTQFSDFISVREGGRPIGFKKEGYPRKVVVDYSLIRDADPRMNRAGYGDLLFMQTTLTDWKIASNAGKGVPYEPELGDKVTELMNRAIDGAAEIGSVSDKGIQDLMELFEVTTELTMSNLSKPIDAGAEHLFAWNLEGVTGRHFIHGEIVSLGILISSFLQKSHHEELREALDKSNVKYHPDEIGVTWDEIKESLITVDEYNRRVRKFNTIFQEVKWTPALLKDIQAMIYN